jgi:MFS family permease
MAATAAAAALVYVAAAPVAALLGVTVAFGFSMGAATTAVYAAATKAVPAAGRNLAFAYLTRAYLIGLAVSPVIAGFIGSLSMRAVFLADAMGLGVVAWIVRRRMS